MLSRNGPHFSPEPDDTGPYPAGSMDGPSKLYRSTAHGGLREPTGRRTDALGKIALPDGDVRPTAGYAHTQPFDDWLARYEFTGDKKDLDHACDLADAYIRSQIKIPPAKDLGPQPFFYYHHIPAHLAWTIDYLVTEAEVLSEGKIAFPSLRQDGYAYFDSRIFGHAPGRVFDDAEAWLLFRRGLVSLDNVQVNYLTAHGPNSLHMILTNQSREQQKVTVKLSAEALKLDPAKPIQATLRVGSAEPVQVTVDQGRTPISMPPRGLAVPTVAGIQLDISAHGSAEPPHPPRADSLVSLRDDVALTRAALIRVQVGQSDAYIWSSASPKEARSASLRLIRIVN